jgi:putative methionine-R-sulfoxide reductase with GAF domain
VSRDALEALDGILASGGEPDDVLRETVALLATHEKIAWAGIAFVDQGVLVLGPTAGDADEARRTSTTIEFQGTKVGELWIDGDAERGLLDAVAARLAGHVLIGWDTRGEAWEP